MEVKEKSKKRELIKTIAIIFLAVLLVLTFFSQTIMNRSLPEVATQLVTSGTINAKIRGSGTVSANESYEVILDQTREIRSVCVKVGDKVEQGDLLFVLGDVESQELKEAQESLSKQQIEYQKQILSYSKDYATEDLSVKNLREDLQKALAARDANLVTETDISYAKGDLAAAQTQLSQLTRMIEELKAIQAESEEYTEAQTKVKELEGKAETLNTTIETKRKKLNDVTADDALSADRKIEDARRALEEAQTNWAGDWAANVDVLNSLGELNLPATPRALSSYEQVQIEGKLGELQRAEWNTPAPSPDGDGDGKAMRQSNAYGYVRCLAAYNTLLADQKDVADKQQAYQRALQDKDASAVEKDMLTTLEVCYEFYLRGFQFDRMDLYQSRALHFAVDEERGALRPPFVSVAGLGETAAISLEEQREGKSFISIEEVSAACPKVSKTHIQLLKEAGAFGNLPETSQMDLFSMFG